MAQELETAVLQKMIYISPRACEKVIHAKNFVPAGQKAFA